METTGRFRAAAALTAVAVAALAGCSAWSPEPINGPVTVDRTGRVLRVPVRVEGCLMVRVHAAQGPATVSLTVESRERPAGGACPAIAGHGAVEVVLARPLAGRRLRDAATGAFLPPPGLSPTAPASR